MLKINYFSEFLILTAGPQIFITGVKYNIFQSENRKRRTSSTKNFKSFRQNKGHLKNLFSITLHHLQTPIEYDLPQCCFSLSFSCLSTPSPLTNLLSSTVGYMPHEHGSSLLSRQMLCLPLLIAGQTNVKCHQINHCIFNPVSMCQ